MNLKTSRVPEGPGAHLEGGDQTMSGQVPPASFLLPALGPGSGTSLLVCSGLQATVRNEHHL